MSSYHWLVFLLPVPSSIHSKQIRLYDNNALSIRLLGNYNLDVQEGLIICVFHICRFACSLKCTLPPKVSAHRASEVIQRHAQSGETESCQAQLLSPLPSYLSGRPVNERPAHGLLLPGVCTVVLLAGDVTVSDSPQEGAERCAPGACEVSVLSRLSQAQSSSPWQGVQC